MKSIFIKIILALVTAVMTVTAPFNNVKAPEDKSGFVPVIRFTVASDTHIQAAGFERTQRMQKVMSLAYNDAQQDENYKRVDAFLWAGDLTDQGYKVQFLNFLGTVKSMKKDETQLLAVLAKSHDGYTMENGTQEYFTDITGQPTDFHEVINGFHFIGLSASHIKDEHYSTYQREWLKEELAKAAADDPQKPIFVMQHEHVKDTVYGSFEEDGWGMDYFRDILNEYPQIVDFSGHSHYPLNDPRSVWQGEFTAVGTGALKYAEFTVDGERTVHPDGYKKIAQSWIVEVDKDNTVRLRGFDNLTGTLLCEYFIKNPADINARQFTPAQQKSISSAPVFNEGAKLTAKKIAGKYKITAPAAESTDGFPVFLYRFYIYDKDGNLTETKWVLNNYWKSETYESITEKFEAEKGFTVKFTAENAYGMKSAELEITL